MKTLGLATTFQVSDLEVSLGYCIVVLDPDGNVVTVGQEVKK